MVFHIDTDAPLNPPPDASFDPMRTPGLFDKLVIQLYSPLSDTPCGTCTYERSVDEDLFARGATMTVRGNVDRARVRLFRSVDRQNDDISLDTTLEMVVRLPRPPAEGAVHASIELGTESVGNPVGKLDAPAPVTLGAPSRSRVGTWGQARRTPCKEAPREGEVCIPGGAYFMGSKDRPDVKLDPYPLRQRLVVLSPFYLDSREVTQRAIADWLTRTHRESKDVLVTWSATSPFCTFQQPNEELPINCISKDAALEYCRSRGGTLPSEAEFEYAMSALTALPYVWGSESPDCEWAVWDRGTGCGAPSSTGPFPWANTPERVGRDDLTVPTGGHVYDLVGNLSEMALDVASVEDDRCWSAPNSNVYINPVCTQPSADPELPPRSSMVRGGSFSSDLAVYLRASHRGVRALDVTPPRIDIGFRCARH
ncbi:formylglycine-generating enzyme family protein [Pendulispora rubella]|uniref:Formylglycine-generating enzyme family protein n=1 Tax=Pendulispora rubella TaxID=2741070 RepID=A0ABZ2L372_9BACT